MDWPFWVGLVAIVTYSGGLRRGAAKPRWPTRWQRPEGQEPR